jgi:hypothetical protein
MIPLTLRAMLGKRHHQSRRRSASAVGLPSVLAVLALACSPALAHADSSGAQYQTAVPTITGNSGTPTHSSNPSATASNGAGVPTVSGKPGSGGSGSGNPSATSGNPSTGGGGGTGHDKSGNGSTKNPVKAGGGGSGQVSPGVPASSGDGGSSPVLPILIAIVLLAAVSIGVVMMRQRRQRQEGLDDDPTAAPEDGPDSGTAVTPKAG